MTMIETHFVAGHVADSDGRTVGRTNVTDRQMSPPNPAPDARGATGQTGQPNGAPAKVRWRVPLWLVALFGFLGALAAYVYVPGIYVVATDDAYVQADTVSVVPKVAAYVSALHVTDNQKVAAGQLLVELDPRDFQVAVD